MIQIILTGLNARLKQGVWSFNVRFQDSVESWLRLKRHLWVGHES